MTKTGFAVAFLVAFGSVAACSDQRVPSESTATANAPIQGGTDDGTAHPFAVGFCIDPSGSPDPSDCNSLQVDICSGALIAPNLVVTARHCVQNTDEQIDCATSSFSGQRGNGFYITTDPDFASATHWHQVTNINVPTPTPVCGNDIALLTLADDVPAAEATPITPVVQYPMTTHPMYSLQVTAIGYGATEAGTNPPGAGTRRIKENIILECADGDPRLVKACTGVFDSGSVDPKEFITGPGTCQGDSGSSAYDQTTFAAGKYNSFGVLSRGGESGTTCEDAIYTRLDAWRDLIVQVATTAAAAGGYPVPDWTKPAPPIVDSGTPAQTGTGQIGDSCTGNSDCASNDCSHDTCTQACDDTNTCPDGFDCTGGFCAASTNANNADSTTTTTTTTCGCKLAGGPSSPVPWKTLGIALGAMMVFRRRSSAGARRRRDRTK